MRPQLCFLVFLLGLLFGFCTAGVPTPALYYEDQLVDHHDPTDERRWSQRYYISEEQWRGPGFPFFLILGGESNIEPSTGIVYPFISQHLARNFGAFVIQPEHRYYGQSVPGAGRERLLTPEQALLDALRLVRWYQKRFQCSLHRSSPLYCPLISVGGSYSGFLSAMARLRFPHAVDMAYAGSAPMKFYAQLTHTDAYYDHISHVAEKTVPGCSKHVRSALDAVNRIILEGNDVQSTAIKLGFCPGSVPDYIRSAKTLSEEFIMVVGYTVANDNMANYPPGPRTRFYQMCLLFGSEQEDPITKVSMFLRERLLTTDEGCVPMWSQLPTGPNATISGGDWSGVGFGASGESWDFQTCTLLVEKIGFSNRSLFPPRDWSLAWLTRHCATRFGVTPTPYKLVREWGFDDLVHNTNASRILFTNGLNDGWSVSGIKENLSPSLIALNFENGAHHSDLSGRGPSEEDTEDIRKGFKIIRSILARWLHEVRSEQRAEEVQ